MRITTLVENSRLAERPDLFTEHGLALSIQNDGEHILFDTGASAKLLENAASLAINLETVQHVVISHHHYDHGGGLAAFVSVNSHAPVYLRQSATEDIYSRRKRRKYHYAGLDTTLFQQYPHRFNFVSEFTQINPREFLITEIAKSFPTPRGNRRLFVKQGGRYIRDDFAHELIMVMKERDELIVFTGCAHNGVLNMLETVVNRFPDMRIRAVIGGFHLVGMPKFDPFNRGQRELENIAHALGKYPIQSIYTGHCTGENAYNVLKDILGNKVNPIRTGVTIEL
jgi:7,8-dihydropterin-6-yl-methyl-4-(beta-D-ribofuranosyl)aminobenzene 5'-phosphate synthase